MAMNFCAMNAQSSYCMPNAAAGTSMRENAEILGTVVLAVSIIIRLIALLVLKV